MKAEKRDYQDFLRDILNSIDKIGYFIEEFDFNDFPSFAARVSLREHEVLFASLKRTYRRGNFTSPFIF
jgi:hypothetical protein